LRACGSNPHPRLIKLIHATSKGAKRTSLGCSKRTITDTGDAAHCPASISHRPGSRIASIRRSITSPRKRTTCPRHRIIDCLSRTIRHVLNSIPQSVRCLLLGSLNQLVGLLAEPENALGCDRSADGCGHPTDQLVESLSVFGLVGELDRVKKTRCLLRVLSQSIRKAVVVH
jgi:hypothetical protein